MHDTRRRLGQALVIIGIGLLVTGCGLWPHDKYIDWTFISPESVRPDALHIEVEHASGSVWRYPDSTYEGRYLLSSDAEIRICFTNGSDQSLHIPELTPCPWGDTTYWFNNLRFIVGDPYGRFRANPLLCSYVGDPDSQLIQIDPHSTFCSSYSDHFAHMIETAENTSDSIWLQVGYRNNLYCDTIPAVWLGDVWSDTLWFEVQDAPQ